MKSLPKYTGGMVVAGLVFVSTISTGCATKKYVRNTVAPIDQHVNQVDQNTKQNKDAIAKLGEKEETDVSRVGEQATSAQNAARDAANAAQQADQKAGQAQTMAKNVGDHVDQLNQTWTNNFQNLDNYQLVSTEKVLFPFNKATLTPEAKQKLDAAVQNLSNAQHWVVEIEGYTDSTGHQNYNLALSQKRADAVVRYLMVQHHVPLYRIHVAGLGEQEPASDNHTRAGRKENRRVEVKLFAANLSGTTAPSQQGNMAPAGTTQQDQSTTTTPTTGDQTTTVQPGQTQPGQIETQPGQGQQTMTPQQPTAPGQITPQQQTQPGQMMPSQQQPAQTSPTPTPQEPTTQQPTTTTPEQSPQTPPGQTTPPAEQPNPQQSNPTTTPPPR